MLKLYEVSNMGSRGVWWGGSGVRVWGPPLLYGFSPGLKRGETGGEPEGLTSYESSQSLGRGRVVDVEKVRRIENKNEILRIVCHSCVSHGFVRREVEKRRWHGACIMGGVRPMGGRSDERMVGECVL